MLGAVQTSCDHILAFARPPPPKMITLLSNCDHIWALAGPPSPLKWSQDIWTAPNVLSVSRRSAITSFGTKLYTVFLDFLSRLGCPKCGAFLCCSLVMRRQIWNMVFLGEDSFIQMRFISVITNLFSNAVHLVKSVHFK